MHIAFIGTRGVPATYSGFETCVEQLGLRMVERGHEVTVFCRSGHYAQRRRRYRGMRLRHLPAVPQKHLETLTHSLLSSLFLPRHAAIVCMGVGNAPVVRTLELRRRRAVFNVDGADWQRAKWGGLARRYLRACESAAASGRSPLVADARVVRDEYMRRFNRSSTFIPYGATPPVDTGTAALDGCGLTAGGYALFVGRLVPENAAHDFLEGVRLSGLSIQAAVVGSASYQDDYIAALKQAAPHRVVFTGYQFGAAYQQLSVNAGVFVMSATVGGTHPVLLEQMAAGNCILARETPSHREVLGDSGMYWSTPAELGAALAEVWPDEDRRKALGSAAKARATMNYDWEDITTRYLELCRESLGPARA